MFYACQDPLLGSESPAASETLAPEPLEMSKVTALPSVHCL